MAEMISGVPLFRGRDNNDQLNQIIRILGTPDEATLRRIASESVSEPTFTLVFAAECDRSLTSPKSISDPFPACLKSPLLNSTPKRRPWVRLYSYSLWPGAHRLTQTAIDLLEKLLVFDPSKRLSCEEALKHPCEAFLLSLEV